MITLCATVPTMLGGVITGETVALINIDLLLIRTVSEDEDTKMTVITYHSGNIQIINMPFTTFTGLITQQQQLVVYGHEKIVELSPNMKHIIMPTQPTDPNTIIYGYQPKPNHGRNSL